MPRKRYKFGPHTFTSKDAVRKHAGRLRDRHVAGETVTDGDDLAFIRDLLACHVEREAKIGRGVRRFFVDHAPDHPGCCFWLERTDDSTTDFGVPSCLKGVGSINRLSLRMAIKPQLDAFKMGRLSGIQREFVSEFSGKQFLVEDAVADHARPFEKIVVDFFSGRGIDLETEMLTRSVDQQSDPEWRDPRLLEDFLAFHAGFPLRLVHWRENLSELRRTQADTAED